MIFSKDFVKGELYLTKDTFKLIRLSDRLLIDFTENDWVIFIGLEVLVVRYQWIFLTNKGLCYEASSDHMNFWLLKNKTDE